MQILDKITEVEKEATDFGFNWTEPQQIIQQISSEVKEIEAELTQNNRNLLQEEIGDLLHAVCSLCLFCGFEIEATLTIANDKFAKRFLQLSNMPSKKVMKICEASHSMN